ncbi:hypothetical protein L0128_02475 [candidate division KSB1 bacterium]|nr:hypothetical protein [candidate division KSB1 bacterium]
MITSNRQHPISADLLKITERDVSLLDQEISDGRAWELYCNGHITRPTVFNNQITGIFYAGLEQFMIEIHVNGVEISSHCSCGNDGGICQHVVVLLYSWINDSENFENVGNSLEELKQKNKDELLEIITWMLTKNPQNIFLLNKRDALDSDLNDIDGMLN